MHSARGAPRIKRSGLHCAPLPRLASRSPRLRGAGAEATRSGTSAHAGSHRLIPRCPYSARYIDEEVEALSIVPEVPGREGSEAGSGPWRERRQGPPRQQAPAPPDRAFPYLKASNSSLVYLGIKFELLVIADRPASLRPLTTLPTSTSA